MDRPVEFPTQAKIRIKDIALKANVSVGTVDRVLHNRGEVAPETRELIHKIISELQYKPNVIASALAMKKAFSVGLLMPAPTEKNSYWKLHLKGIEKALEEMNYLEITLKNFFFDISNVTTAESEVDALLEAKPDAIIVIPAFGKSNKAIQKKLKESGIHCIYLDIPVEEESEALFIGPDAFNEGYLGAKMMSYGTSKETTVLIVNIKSEALCNPHCNERAKGFMSYLKEHNITETKVRTVDVPTSSDADVKKYMYEAFLNHSFVRGLFVTGSEAYRIAKFVQEKKLGNIRIVGFDLLESNVNYLKKGLIDFLITQKPEIQGHLGMTSIIKSQVLKLNIPMESLLPLDIITKENVDYHLSI